MESTNMILNLFFKQKIPNKIPKEIEKSITLLKKAKNKKDCLKKTYSLLANKYKGKRIKTYLKLFDLFSFDLNKIWRKTGFLHCVHLNYLLKILLVKSEFFKTEDIKIKWTLVWYISPHQYLNIKIDKHQSINVDLWGKVYGIKFGDYAHGFS